MDYRFYLLDEDDRFRAAESFYASTDIQAAEIAASVHEACADVFDGYELWRGAECLMRRQRNLAPDAKPISWAMAKARQEKTIELEERLQNGFACVRKSQRLLETTATLRDRTPTP